MKLRELKSEDNRALVKHLNNKQVIKYLTSRIPYPYTDKDATWWIEIGSQEDITRAIEVDGELAGIIGITQGENQHSRCAEIGYWLGEEYWGKGYATQAITELTNFIFVSTEIVRIFAPVFEPNKASMRALEKSGYQLEGILKKRVFKDGVFYNEHIFAKLTQD